MFIYIRLTLLYYLEPMSEYYYAYMAVINLLVVYGKLHNHSFAAF